MKNILAGVIAAFALVHPVQADVVSRADFDAALEQASKAADALLAQDATLRTDLDAASASLTLAQQQIAADTTLIASLRAIAPPPTVSLIASPTSIKFGESSTLALSAVNTEACTPTGWDMLTPVVSPQTTTTYSIDCLGWSGAAVSASAQVTVELPPPSIADPSNTITITDMSGTAQTNYPLQIARPFVCGRIRHYPQFVRDGVPLPTQADVKKRCPDGSVSHAVLSAMVSIPANGSVTLGLADQPDGNNTPLTKEQMLDPAYNFDAKTQLAFTSGTNGTASGRAMLQAGDYKLWTSGPIAQTIELADDTTARKDDLGNGDGYHPFRPRFYATFWPATHQVTVRFVGENGLTTELEDLAYNLTLSLGNTNPVTVYSADLTGTQTTSPVKKHWARSNWTKTFWIGGAPEAKINIDHNIKYLTSTRYIPNFDTSKPIDPAAVTQLWNSWSGRANDLYDIQEKGTGLWTGGMTTTGGRPDIAPYPPWAVYWLHTGDWRMRAVALNMADLASAWRVNLRESDPNPRKFSRDDPLGTALGRPISISARPTIYTTIMGFSSTKPTDQVRIVGPIAADSTAGWFYDSAHEPSPFYPQYVLTGDPYYLQLMYNWAAHDAGVSWGNRGNIGVVTNQLRGAAWVGVHRAETAFIAPDGTPEKHYFTYSTNDALATWESGFKITGTVFDGTVAKVGTNYYSRNSNSGPFAGQPPILHNWESNAMGGTVFAPGADITSAEGTVYKAGVVGSATSPWMQFYVLYAIGRMTELGFAAGPLLAHTGTWLVDMVAASPGMVNAYRAAVEKRGGGFMTWPEVIDAYYPGYLDIRLLPLTKPITGESYLNYTRSGVSYLLDNDVSGADVTEATLGAFYKNVTWNGAQAVWNIVPRSDKNVLPEQSTAIPAL